MTEKEQLELKYNVALMNVLMEMSDIHTGWFIDKFTKQTKLKYNNFRRQWDAFHKYMKHGATDEVLDVADDLAGDMLEVFYLCMMKEGRLDEIKSLIKSLDNETITTGKGDSTTLVQDIQDGNEPDKQPKG